MRIAVIGAGIGGLAAAAGLQRDGHEATVLEQRPEAGASGSGLTLFGNAFAALDLLGVGDAVRAVSGTAIAGMRAGHRAPDGAWLAVAPASATATLRSVHRESLHAALRDALDPGSLRTGVAARIIDPHRGEVLLRSSTGEARAERFDVVIAADGIRSAARGTLGLDHGLRYAGYTAWRGVTDGPFDLRGEAGETWGAGARFGLVPLADDRVYWFATATRPEGFAPAEHRAEAAALVAGWHAPIGELIAATAPERVLRHDIHDLRRLPRRFAVGAVALLGDATHAMTPDLGQGAGLAIEDAGTLVALLRRHRPAEALEHYDRLRRPRAAALHRRSRAMGRIGQWAHPLASGLRDAGLRATPPSVIGRAALALQRWQPPRT